MKHITTVVLMLNFGAASIYAHQKPVKMTFSGTAGPSAINLQQPGTGKVWVVSHGKSGIVLGHR